MRPIPIFLFLLLLGISFSLDLNSTVKYAHNGSVVSNANVTIYQYAFSPNGENITIANTSITNASGQFNISLDESIELAYLEITKYNASGSLKYMSQKMFPLPLQILNGSFNTLNNVNLSIYLKPAATIFVNATNETGSPANFGFFAKERKYNVDYLFDYNVTNVTLNVVTDQNYTVTVYQKSDIDRSGQGAFPQTFLITTSNLTNDLTNGVYYLSVNLSTPPSYVIGNITATQNTSAVNFTNILFYPYIDGEWHYCTFCLPIDPIGDGIPGSSLNSATGAFVAQLPSSPGGINYMAFAMGNNSLYYGSFQNFTLVTDTNTSLNITMRALLGDYLPTGYTGDSNTSKFVVYLNNSVTGSVDTRGGDMKITVEDYNDFGSFTHRMFVASNDSGAILFPVINNTNISYEVYAQSFPPKKGDLSLTSSPEYIQMSSMQPRDIDGRELFSSMTVTFYISNTTCDVPQPATNCVLATFGMTNDSVGSFDPIAFVMAAINSSIAFQVGDTIVHLYNVDIIASGPPNFEKDDEITQSGASSAQRIGSSVPDVFDTALASFTYNPNNVNENQNITASINQLYDDDWNLVWSTNSSSDNSSYLSSSVLAGYYSDYAQGKYACLVNASTGPCDCSETNSSATCFVNKSLNRVWIAVPHFSGGNMQVSGTAVSVASADGGSSSGAQKDLELSYEFSCIDSTLTVTTSTQGATVSIIGTLFAYSDSAQTDSDGVATIIVDQDGVYNIMGSKSGYKSDSIVAVGLVSCKEDANYSQEVECSVDADCPGYQYCTKDGACNNLVGSECGYIEDHKYIEYACCVPQDCDVGYDCVEHECVELPSSDEEVAAQDALDSAQEEISSAKSNGLKTKKAEQKLLDAQKAFDQGNFELAQELAQKALTLIEQPESNQPSDEPLEEPTQVKEEPDNTGILAGLGILGLGAIVLIILVVLYFVFRKKGKKGYKK